jgi:hypothetical protein
MDDKYIYIYAEQMDTMAIYVYIYTPNLNWSELNWANIYSLYNSPSTLSWVVSVLPSVNSSLLLVFACKLVTLVLRQSQARRERMRGLRMSRARSRGQVTLTRGGFFSLHSLLISIVWELGIC